ncbi:HPP family protein [Bordetella sp. H567]|uniref:HPP family protein n=1 Tax=Bordetella sp. H567 TaxID=1697043 RepID=UPI000ACE6E4C|nr:HPP family protein [Bordetella sp. H567]
MLSRFKHVLSAFAPAPVGASARDKFLGALGALLGLLCTEWISRHALGEANPWFIAPMGASAVLAFAAPASPLAQPWSLVAGNISAALVGVFFAQWIPEPGLAAACAAAAAIAVMFSLRCLHPPSGAVALTAVLGGPSIAKLGYGYALYPVALNSAMLLCVAIVFNGVLKRNYPHRHVGTAPAVLNHAAATRLGFTSADLDEALRNHDQLLDISKEDLADIVLEAERRASLRRFGGLDCAQVMARDVVTVRDDEALDQAVRLLDRHRLAALPVVDEQGRLLGLLSHGDAVARKLRLELAPPLGVAAPALAVRDCMRSEVAFATPSMPAIELAKAMASGIACVPVVDATRTLVGAIYPSQLIDALYQLALASPEPAAVAALGAAA